MNWWASDRNSTGYVSAVTIIISLHNQGTSPVSEFSFILPRALTKGAFLIAMSDFSQVVNF